jgi:hypothetical protein
MPSALVCHVSPFNTPVLFWTAYPSRHGYDRAMATVALYQFIGAHREELIHRCEDKVANRSGPQTTGATPAEKEHGVPLFLDQLVEELRHGRSKNEDITKASTQHGGDLLRQGFTVSQVVHDYGDVCQSVTDLAMETNAPIAIDDFRTLNRCLDDAIAGAVTEHARGQQITRDGQSDDLRHLTNTAITAFEALQSGTVGVGGTTGALVLRSLMGIRALIDRPVPKPPTVEAVL